MAASPTVSVLIPTYNRAEMVSEAIQSVLNQTFTDFEIVVVDDGSTDHTRKVVETFGKPVRYFYQANQGPSVARNHALEEARGQFITFLDSDDLYLPEKLEKQVTYMQAHPSVGMVYTAFERIQMDGTLIDTHRAQLAGHIHSQLLWNCVIATASVMLRRTVVERVGEFDPSLPITEDVDYWLRVARQHEIGAIDEMLVQIRLHYDENLVRNPERVLRYLPYVMEKNSADYNLLFRHRLYANVYFRNGLQLLNHAPEKLDKAWQVFFKGLLYWPFDRSMPLYLGRLLFRTLVPELLKRRLRTLWRGITPDT